MNNNKSKPIVSVLIPVYNAGHFLLDSVESIVQQTYKELEIIIINDGSTDGCVEILRKNIVDVRIKIIEKENGGKSSALNVAFKILKGSFWMIQDADDISKPYRVERLLDVLLNNNILAAVYSGIDLIFRDRIFAPVFPKSTIEMCRKDILNFKLPAHDASGMYRTSMTKGILFDEELRIGQGVDYVWRVGEKFPISVLEDVLYTHRVNHQSVTHNTPSTNFEKINVVINKACARRGLNYNNFKLKSQPKLLKSERGIDSILPYAIESVLALKRRKEYIQAIKTAVLCIAFHPLDYMYYKPLIYLIAPVWFVEKYREIKNSERLG